MSIDGEPIASELPREAVERAADLLREHVDLVARFGLGHAPTFKQTFNRVLARLDGENRRVEPMTEPPRSGL